MAEMNDTSIKAVRSLFGAHPEEVISPIKSAADALLWVEEILRTISREAMDERNGCRIKNLADAGAHLASDVGNFAGHAHETMIEHLSTALKAEVGAA